MATAAATADFQSIPPSPFLGAPTGATAARICPARQLAQLRGEQFDDSSNQKIHHEHVHYVANHWVSAFFYRFRRRYDRTRRGKCPSRHGGLASRGRLGGIHCLTGGRTLGAITMPLSIICPRLSPSRRRGSLAGQRIEHCQKSQV